jgi:uncharacterized membrane protein
MLPLLVLIASTLVLRAVGAAGVLVLESWSICLRGGLAAMFLLTASAHWGRRRRDLIQMVPAAFPRPDLIVTITGLLEILGAAGLLLPRTAGAAAACLAVLLVAMFSANVRAAQHRLTIGGKPATALPLRTLLQIVFVTALLAAGFPDSLNDVAVWLAPGKTARPDISEKAKQANARFWDALHGGRYEELPQVLETLTAAYVENPNDAQTAAHIGFSHVWLLSEHARLERPRATIADELVLARKYLSEAVQLAPDDQRFRGFLASMELGEGSVHGDEKLKRRGYFDLMKARDAWPEFNLFTAGYTMSRLPTTDPKYADAVDYQWQTLDLCAGEKVDRRAPQYGKYMSKETTTGTKRACWNSWIAPHNFEGFFLNMGDMVVKQGDPATAAPVYANAKLSKTYDAWPFKQVLEDRIAQAGENVALFRRDRAGEKTRVMMGASTFACTGCHQQ